MAFVYCGDLRWGEAADAGPRSPGPAFFGAPPPARCPPPPPHAPLSPPPPHGPAAPWPSSSTAPRPDPPSFSHALRHPTTALRAPLPPPPEPAPHLPGPRPLPRLSRRSIPTVPGSPRLALPTLPRPPPQPAAPSPPGRARTAAVGVGRGRWSGPSDCGDTERPSVPSGPGGGLGPAGNPARRPAGSHGPPGSRELDGAGPHRDRCLRRSRCRSCGPAGTCSRPSAPWRRCGSLLPARPAASWVCAPGGGAAAAATAGPVRLRPPHGPAFTIAFRLPRRSQRLNTGRMGQSERRRRCSGPCRPRSRSPRRGWTRIFRA